MRTGDLDTRIRIERRVAASDQDVLSAGSETWEAVATIWAQVQDVLPSRGERLADGLNIASRPARIRMRYRRDIDPGMRIVIGSLDQPDDPPPVGRRILQIVAGPAMLGRRDGTEIMAEEMSTKGNAG